MNNDIAFDAPWSNSLRRSTVVACSALAVIALSGVVSAAKASWPVTTLLVALPIAIIGVTLPFMIRGYIVTETEILVRRLGRVTPLPLAGLISVAGNNEAMARSIRLFGNGGLFAYCGEYWNRALGRYRALATDPSRAVILRYAKRRIVVTPGDPQRFIVRVRTLLKNSQD